jgi:hypothetical protein
VPVRYLAYRLVLPAGDQTRRATPGPTWSNTLGPAVRDRTPCRRVNGADALPVDRRYPPRTRLARPIDARLTKKLELPDVQATHDTSGEAGGAGPFLAETEVIGFYRPEQAAAATRTSMTHGRPVAGVPARRWQLVPVRAEAGAGGCAAQGADRPGG